MTIKGKTVNLTDAEYDGMLRDRGQLILQKYKSARSMWRINSMNPKKQDIERISNIIDSAHQETLKKYREIVAKRATRVNSYK